MKIEEELEGIEGTVEEILNENHRVAKTTFLLVWQTFKLMEEILGSDHQFTVEEVTQIIGEMYESTKDDLLK